MPTSRIPTATISRCWSRPGTSGRIDPMLGMKKYPEYYIAACRARLEVDLRAYRSQVGKAPSSEFEARFFNDQVLLLDYMFVHRLTGIEGKDGNPLNEVRVLCNSILLKRENYKSTNSKDVPTLSAQASSSRQRDLSSS